MNDLNEFETVIRKVKGKTIAIVYTFEGDTDLGLKHFYTWKSDIITKWMNAIQNLSCLPLILDVKTFVDKAINKTLPVIDYVINLNTGIYDLSSMALIPSICSAINVPCIPCDAMTITAGENKNISNLIAQGIGLNVPQKLDSKNSLGIFRPINLGNSLGVTKGFSNHVEGIYQEFIDGYEITTPILYNPILKKMDVLPTVIFFPNNCSSEWYYSKNDKSNQNGYHFKIASISEELKQKYLDLVKNMNIHTYCRIDARVKCHELLEKNDYMFSLEETFFIEVNVMPTIRANNSFNYSFESINSNTSFYKFKNIFTQKINNDIYTFILSCSLLYFELNKKHL